MVLLQTGHSNPDNRPNELDRDRKKGNISLEDGDDGSDGRRWMTATNLISADISRYAKTEMNTN